MAYIFSQVLVCIADLFYVISMFAKKKLNLVVFLFISDVLFASHYLLLKGGLTGATTIFVDCAFLIIMYLLEKFNKTKYNIIVTLITIAIIITLSILTWQGAISLLPMFAMLCYLTTMIFTNVAISKTGAFMRNLLNIVYMFLIASYFGAGLEIALMISAVIGIILDVKRNKNKNKNVDTTQTLDSTNASTPTDNVIEAQTSQQK